MEPLQELVGPILDYPLEKPSESSVPGSSNVNSNINSDIPTIDTAIGYNLISNEAPKDKNTPVKVASHLILSKPVPDRKRASGDRVPSIFSQNPVSEEAFGEPWFHHLQPKPLCVSIRTSITMSFTYS